MFVKEILGEIIEISNEKLDNDFIEAKEELVRGFDHKFYYISQTKTDEYKLAEKEYLYNQELKLLRDKREKECFSVVDKGRFWYESLTQEQIIELKEWYTKWLDVTKTRVIPDKPKWL